MGLGGSDRTRLGKLCMEMREHPNSVVLYIVRLNQTNLASTHQNTVAFWFCTVYSCDLDLAIEFMDFGHVMQFRTRNLLVDAGAALLHLRRGAHKISFSSEDLPDLTRRRGGHDGRSRGARLCTTALTLFTLSTLSFTRQALRGAQ